MTHVFLSYAREDRERVAPLVELLTSMGVSVFWDRLVPAGSSWREVLDRELSSTDTIVVAWSEHSIGSEWVIEEADVGKKRGRLLPFLLDSVEPPMGFRSYQAADLSSWKGELDDPEAREFAAEVARHVGKDVHESPSAPTEARSGARGIPRRVLWVGVPAVVAITATALWLTSRGGGTRGAVDEERDQHSTADLAGTAPEEVATEVLEGGSSPAEPTTGEPSTSPQVAPYRRVYYEGFSAADKVETAIWPIGARGDWHGELVDEGVFRLCNRSGAETASFTSKTIYTEEGIPSVDHTNAKVVVTVRLQGTTSHYSSAGLMYRATDEDAYYAFALSAGHSVTFLRTEGTKVSIVGTWVLNGFEDGQWATLSIEGDGDTFSLHIDDKLVHTVKDAHVEAGYPGVFTMGLGCFDFENYGLLLPADEVSSVASQ